MGFFIHHDQQRNFLLTIFHGRVHADDLTSYTQEILGDHYSRAGKRRLTILCENASAHLLDHHAVYSAGKQLQKARFRPNGKLAIVAKNTVGFGMAKMYQLASEVSGLDEIRVFRGHELDSAITWLDSSDLAATVQQKIDCYEESISATT